MDFIEISFEDLVIGDKFMRFNDDTIYTKILDDDGKVIATDDTGNVISASGNVRKIIK